MNGRFPNVDATRRVASMSASSNMPPTFSIDKIQLQGAVGMGTDKKPHKLYDPVKRQKTLRKHAQASADYVNIARPLDLRFAQKVHGAALAPPWEYVWTDDTEVSTD
eukprot:2220114-Rhodomonas_salina.1